MLRSAGFALAWLGLSAMTMGLSLSACYGDVTTDKKGDCEDDGNPCTEDTCTSSTTDHRPKNDGEGCTLGSNTGTCQEGDCTLACGHEGEPDCACVSDVDCPLDTECSDWSCDTVSGKCVNAMMPDDTEVGTQVPGDCQRVQCRAGVVDPRPDPNDLPSNVVGDCKQYYCDNITPKTKNDPADRPMEIPGDCNQFVCVNEKAEKMPDDTDKPASTGCVTKGCSAGVITELPAAVGTACMNNMGACNTDGVCADCLKVIEFGACTGLNGGVCPVKLCNGQPSMNATSCQSGKIADKVCCDTSCSEVCKSCEVMGMVGTCSNVPYYQADPSDGSGSSPTCDISANSSRCDGAGKCLGVSGSTCQIDAHCISKKCGSALKCLGAPGEFCNVGTDCVSGTCSAAKACN